MMAEVGTPWKRRVCTNPLIVLPWKLMKSPWGLRAVDLTVLFPGGSSILSEVPDMVAVRVSPDAIVAWRVSPSLGVNTRVSRLA